jgi:DNA mismatch repair protein MutS
MKPINIYDEYENYVKTYSAEYGNNTVVLMMVGSFYEMYSIDDGLVDIHKVADILGIQVSRRNKAVLEVSKANTKMCGFPAYCLQKFVNILVEHQYTVIVVSQTTPAPKPKRGVTMIVSPGTRLDDIPFIESNNLMTIYIEEVFDYTTKRHVLGIGVTSIDVTTGVSKVYETWAKPFDSNLAEDNVYRFVIAENPKEVVIYNLSKTATDKFIALWELEKTYVHDKKILPDEITTPSFQNQFLKKVFPNHGLYTPVEYINLENKRLGLVSFISCLQFAFRHSENILKDIQIPVIIEENKSLLLSYNSIKQLGVFDSNCGFSLLSILNNTHTSIGKRFFKDRLLNPINNVKLLQNYYDTVENLLDCCNEIGKHLSHIYDIERLFKKLSLNTIHPADFNAICSSLECVNTIYNNFNTCGIIQEDTFTISSNILSDILKTIDIDECKKYHRDNITSSFFKKSVSETIDTLMNKTNSMENAFADLATFLNNQCVTDAQFFKTDYNERDGHYLTITKKRYNDLFNKLKNTSCSFHDVTINFSDISTKAISSSNTSYKLSHNLFDKINSELQTCKEELRNAIIKEFDIFVSTIYETYQYEFHKIIKSIGYLDFVITNAKNATKFNYVKPIIHDNPKAFVKAKSMRHPIIEQILHNVEYVPNDISLGVDYDGILLYGINSAGKSSLMKAIGLNVIMASAGMYVPCAHFEFSPYNSIFTRIPTGDNIAKGQSTFTSEVAEIRNILKRADCNSLVIGDELCSGTESISALSIVSAGIIELSSRKTSWIFASHLHDLLNIPHVQSVTNMSVKHLSVKCDETTKTLVYDRILKDGQGQTVYGLEVCKALDLDPAFLNTACEIRQHLLGMEKTIISTKRSKHNKDHYIDTCYFCQKPSQEVHHIKHQKFANKNGFIDSIHKNRLFNLLNVCQKCHDDIHANKIIVNGFINTTNGIELQFTKT